ncbi:hypothetical protein HK104_008944 [Borealophlyctis nickersoniae]|nr:hypothetical protein HK104_008944 [Borealophlyctis nickersoniae]
MSSVAGIREVDGDRLVGGTRRPDGSVRKERKVRPGFVPQEDVSRYTNEKVELTRVPKGYVPGANVAPRSAGDAAGNTAGGPPKSKSAKKNAARNAKKQAERDATNAGTGTGTETGTGAGGNGAAPSGTVRAGEGGSNSAAATTQSSAPAPPPAATGAADAEKKLKNLRKKLRQIEEIQARADKGEALLPEQKEKLAARSKVDQEIGDLEAAVKKMQI